jgi:OTU domain-containing protein 6
MRPRTPPPSRHTAMDALLKRHAAESASLDASLRLVAPKATRFAKPTPAQVAAHESVASRQRADLCARHAAEVSSFDADAALAPPTDAAAAADATARAPTAAAAADGGDGDDDDGSDDAADDDGVSPSGAAGVAAAARRGGESKRGKAARRRARKEDRAAAERAAARADDDASSSAPRESQRDAELRVLRAQLRPLALSIAHVAGDGHCLFRAVAHQLALTAAADAAAAGALVPAAVPFAEVRRLRTRASEFILSFWEEFAPFLPYETDDMFPEAGAAAGGAAAVRAAVARYAARLEGSSCWGGHPELRALANVTGCPIVVHRAGAAPLQFGPRGDETEAHGDRQRRRNALNVSLHLHYYSSEHYNSCVTAAP